MPTLIVSAVAVLLQHYPTALVTIEVRADREVRAHSITISPPHAGPFRTDAERDNMVWVAVRRWEGGHETLTSDECPAIARVAASMDSLPPLPISPPSRALVGPSMTMPPTIKDGYGTSLSFRTRNTDNSFSDVTISGGFRYMDWGNTAVSALLECWGPLTP